ncbi:LysE family translocator [Ferrimonas lipolytica]|uniref:LysE family translocator n=1 Tax=Ferrimonas lipolytica TaxID=2724191 RepID=A0A6H1UGJ9_9GAMM|nr:LysE family translocator [Ferrimonas lipolytica]QIZ77948.1 LysE family translocator [Ferrimonas lipolytica]
MSLDILAALMMFALVSTITPGPNNMMLLASGANWGVRRSIPHLLGVAIGFSVMVLMVGIGIMQLFERYPLSNTLLKYGSGSYMVFLAYKIATASAPKLDEVSTSKPISFIQAAMFQWVNPKAWAMAIGAISLYAPNRELSSIGIIALVYGVVNLPSISLWTILGQQLQRVLTNERRLRIFNRTMALLLVLSLWPMLGGMVG